MLEFILNHLPFRGCFRPAESGEGTGSELVNRTEASKSQTRRSSGNPLSITSRIRTFFAQLCCGFPRSKSKQDAQVSKAHPSTMPTPPTIQPIPSASDATRVSDSETSDLSTASDLKEQPDQIEAQLDQVKDQLDQQIDELLGRWPSGEQSQSSSEDVVEPSSEEAVNLQLETATAIKTEIKTEPESEPDTEPQPKPEPQAEPRPRDSEQRASEGPSRSSEDTLQSSAPSVAAPFEKAPSLPVESDVPPVAPDEIPLDVSAKVSLDVSADDLPEVSAKVSPNVPADVSPHVPPVPSVPRTVKTVAEIVQSLNVVRLILQGARNPHAARQKVVAALSNVSVSGQLAPSEFLGAQLLRIMDGKQDQVIEFLAECNASLEQLEAVGELDISDGKIRYLDLIVSIGANTDRLKLTGQVAKPDEAESAVDWLAFTSEGGKRPKLDAVTVGPKAGATPEGLHAVCRLVDWGARLQKPKFEIELTADWVGPLNSLLKLRQSHRNPPVELQGVKVSATFANAAQNLIQLKAARAAGIEVLITGAVELAPERLVDLLAMAREKFKVKVEYSCSLARRPELEQLEAALDRAAKDKDGAVDLDFKQMQRRVKDRIAELKKP